MIPKQLVHKVFNYKMKIKNKRIIITGGTSGVGLEMVKQLYQDNRLIVLSKTQSKLDELANTYKNVQIFSVDLSDISQVEQFASDIREEYDQIDILINNAAIQSTPTFLSKDFDYQTIEKDITTNFTSVCSLCSLLLPMLLNSQKATIMNVNSGLALAPKKTSAIYCATKAAMDVFSRSLSYQLEHTNITVRQAFLDLVDTPMTKGRGKNKMSAHTAAQLIIRGIEHDVINHDLGKVKFLRAWVHIVPWLARSLMKNH